MTRRSASNSSPNGRDARFKAAEVNGVYILITKEPGHLQIEVGNLRTAKAFKMENRDHLEELMLKEFKAKEYDKGLLEGVEYVRKAMDENLKGVKKGERPVPGVVPAGESPGPTTVERPSLFSGGNWLGLLCIGLAVAAVIWVVFAVIRGLSAGRGGYAPGGYGGPAYGGGYGGGGGGGGGGFMSGMLGGLFGAAAGSWLYDRFFHGGGASVGGYDGGTTPGGGGAPRTCPSNRRTPTLPGSAATLATTPAATGTPAAVVTSAVMTVVGVGISAAAATSAVGTQEAAIPAGAATSDR